MVTLIKIVFTIVIYNSVLVTPLCLLNLMPNISKLLVKSRQSDYKSTTKVSCGTAPASCTNSRYRSINGSCNNMKNPTWGTPFTPLERILPNSYADGKHKLTQSSSCKELPSARQISLHMSPDVIVLDNNLTLIAMQWGQIVAHDMSLSDNLSPEQSGITTCCENGELNDASKNTSVCAPIIIPPDDPYNTPEGTKCMDFIRGQTDRNQNCSQSNGPYEQINSVTAYIDLSIVYGNDDEQARSLRDGSGGRLRNVTRKGQSYPPQATNPTQTCIANSSSEPCFVAGDVRINQSPELAILHIILFREHNRVAALLEQLNPQWDDDTIYQEARRIVIALIQHINYYEYLPNILGSDNMIKNNLIFKDQSGYNDNYNINISAAILNEHATAAYRSFHSMIFGILRLYLENRESADYLRLSDWFDRPKVIEDDDNFVKLVRGLVTQQSSATDRFFDDEIINYFFRVQNILGNDLHAIDIQRNRDHGIGRYADARDVCGLPKVTKFSDLEDFIPKNYVKLLQTFYDDVKSIELTVGGLLENHVPGTLAGPTFLCILTEQFFRSRVGDRYFFENGNDPLTAFSLDQLNSIRKHTIARLLCDNADSLSLIQPKAFQLISDANSLVACDSIPTFDINLWKDKTS